MRQVRTRASSARRKTSNASGVRPKRVGRKPRRVALWSGYRRAEHGAPTEVPPHSIRHRRSGIDVHQWPAVASRVHTAGDMGAAKHDYEPHSFAACTGVGQRP